MEKWKLIDGYEFHSVSNYGRFRNDKISKILSPHSNKKRSGYCYISITEKGERKNHIAHRLVAQAFIPNPDNKPAVNHINCITTDNNVKNLEWVTNKENYSHAKKMGRIKITRGESCCSVLTQNIVKKIKEDLLLKKLKHIEIAEKYNTNYSNIAHIKRGSRWGWL